MPTITLKTGRLTEQDRVNAAEAARRLGNAENLPLLSPTVARIVSEVLENIVKFDIQNGDVKISTTKAAEYLNVSRPYLYRLLDEGKIAFQMVGSHRRLSLNDVEAYKAQQDEVSYAAMKALQEQAQELHMGY